MAEKVTTEHLKQRREEILKELEKVNEDLELQLDPDPEEQAIQIEQSDVPISIEANLRRELDQIEDELRSRGESF